MINLFRNIIRSCFDKSFYKESEKDSFGKRYLYLYVVFMFVAIVGTISLVGYYLTNKTEIDKLPTTINTQLNTLFPKDLALRFDNNELSINQPEPYVIGTDNKISTTSTSKQTITVQDGVTTAESTAETKTVTNKEGDFSAIITIDTKADISDFAKYKTVILAMKKGVAMNQSSNSGEVKFYSYSEFLKKVPQPFTFDYISYTQIVNKVRPYVALIPTYLSYGLIIACILLVFVGPLFLSSGVLFNLLFLSIFGYFAAIIIKRKYSYGYIYKHGMYAAIPVILLQLITDFVKIPGIANIWWLIALLFMVIFLPSLEQNKAISSSAEIGKPPSQLDPPPMA